jgi:hypothetical protein
MAADLKPKSALTIRSAERGDIRVVIDGRRFEPNQNFMRIRAIQSGTHNIKVYREKNTGRFSIFGKRYEVIFSRTIRLRNNMHTMITIDRFGRATIQEGRTNGRSNGRNDRDYRNNDRDFDDDGDWNRNNDFEFDGSRERGDYGYNDQDVDYGYGHNRAMSDVDFNRVMQSMQKEWLESSKQKSASQIISTNYLSTDQVIRMLQLFSFESIKLDLAKQAYAKTVDQRNYVVVNDVFSFSSSKDDLARYVRTFRG